uniref:Uncharacterized protein n=1 Tax=Setaria digitata TaxID=48799 RepID=A0A915Q4Y1_9BILA
MISTARILDSFPNEVFSRDSEDRVALHYAAETADAETFKRILEMDHSLVHCQDQNGYTPLLIASMSGNVPAIKLMIENGIQINHLDKDKHSSVHWAVVCGQLEALITLLDNGAKVDCADNQGAQAVHYAAAAENISMERCEAILHVLLKHGARPNARDIDGRTPILWAASYGNLEIIISLLQNGGDVYAVDRDQLGMIHCAASHGQAHIIEYAIRNLDLAIINSVDRNGDTALFYAITLGHYECARLLLLNGAEVNHQDRYLRCPSHCAAAKGQLRMLKLLKHFGGSCGIQNRRGDLPVHEAIQAGAKDCVEYLLALYPSSINASNHEGRTGLHLAAASGNMEMVILLCSRSAIINPLMLYKDKLLTPLDLAKEKNHELVVEYLRLRQGAKLAEELSEETKKLAKSSLQHQISEAREKDRRKNDVSSEKSSGKLTGKESEVRTASQETQTAIPVYRAAATNTSRPESYENTKTTEVLQLTSPVRRFIPKATSTTDLQRYLSLEKKNKQPSQTTLRNPHHENWKVKEVETGKWTNSNQWRSEEDATDDEEGNTKCRKSSRVVINKSQNGCNRELKENSGMHRMHGRKGRMKEKFVKMTRIKKNWSNVDESDDGEEADNGLSLTEMNSSLECRSQNAPKINDKNNFEKQLKELLGTGQVDMYRTESGELTIQRRSNKCKKVARCYIHEEAIFKELTHLKKMQLQYGKVKEQILVQSLINNFCKMHGLNPTHFKFQSFHAWETFLCDQLKLLYLEERNRILNSQRTRYSTGKHKGGCLEQKQACRSSTTLNTIVEGPRSAHSDFSQNTLYAGEKRCNCLYNKRDSV